MFGKKKERNPVQIWKKTIKKESLFKFGRKQERKKACSNLEEKALSGFDAIFELGSKNSKIFIEKFTMKSTKSFPS